MLALLIAATLAQSSPLMVGPVAAPLCATKYLNLTGASGAYASSPDSSANSVTGAIDIRVRAALTDWTSGATQVLLAKASAIPGTVSYAMRVTATGTINLVLSTDGTNASISQSTSAVPTLTDGTAYWLRATASFVSTTVTIRFYTCTANDAATCTQVGIDRTATASAIADSGAPVEIGSSVLGTFNPATGRIYYAEIRSGIDGTVVAKFDPEPGASFTSSTGEVWTVNGAADVRRECL